MESHIGLGSIFWDDNIEKGEKGGQEATTDPQGYHGDHV